jgi:hypothetical protein
MVVGCTKLYVSEQFSNQDQIVIKHGTHKTWVRKAYQQADTHCKQYDLVAMMTSQNCGNKNYLTGVSECFTTFSCTQNKRELETTQMKYLQMIEALEKAQLREQILMRENQEQLLKEHGLRKAREEVKKK